MSISKGRVGWMGGELAELWRALWVEEVVLLNGRVAILEEMALIAAVVDSVPGAVLLTDAFEFRILTTPEGREAIADALDELQGSEVEDDDDELPFWGWAEEGEA